MATIPEGIPPWRAVLYDGRSVELAEQARTMFRVAIEPVCAGVAEKLNLVERGSDSATAKQWGALRETQLELHRSFALALGGMWERHFRRHLWHSAAVIGPKSKRFLNGIEQGNWGVLAQAFEAVRGFPLSAFQSGPVLALLFDVASAVRHGNGSTTERLYSSHPELFSHKAIRDWHSYLTLGGEPPHSIHSLDITLDHLSSFAGGIVDFWETVRELQRTSKE